jgi:DNA-directed RNA polymerase specialized sigma24 family protein
MGSSFATTRWSKVLSAGGGDAAAAQAAMAWLCERQWEPLLRAARRIGLPASEAEDAVQDFCVRLIERRADLAGLDPAVGRFRAWLIVVFRRFLADRRARDAAAKRGGGSHMVAADWADPVAPAEPALDAVFDRDWAETLLARGLDRLAAESGEDPARFAALRSFLAGSAGPEDYARAGAGIGLGEGAVKVAVHRLRSRLRGILRQEVAETLATPSPEAIDDELAALKQALAGGL